MNEWGEIRDIFHRRFKSAMFAFVSTLIATVALDLTQAIILGVGLSALIFVFQSSRAKVTFAPVSVEKMRADGYEMQYDADRILVIYITGPLFFGTVNTFNTVLEKLNGNEDIILSLRTVPLLDTTGISAIEDLIHQLENEGRRVYLQRTHRAGTLIPRTRWCDSTFGGKSHLLECLRGDYGCRPLPGEC